MRGALNGAVITVVVQIWHAWLLFEVRMKCKRVKFYRVIDTRLALVDPIILILKLKTIRIFFLNWFKCIFNSITQFYTEINTIQTLLTICLIHQHAMAVKMFAFRIFCTKPVIVIWEYLTLLSLLDFFVSTKLKIVCNVFKRGGGGMVGGRVSGKTSIYGFLGEKID